MIMLALLGAMYVWAAWTTFVVVMPYVEGDEVKIKAHLLIAVVWPLFGATVLLMFITRRLRRDHH